MELQNGEFCHSNNQKQEHIWATEWNSVKANVVCNIDELQTISMSMYNQPNEKIAG
jgi:hypothetical protein